MTISIKSIERLADSFEGIAKAIAKLGNGDAYTSIGAIEGLSMMIKEGLIEASIHIAESNDSIAESNREIAEAILTLSKTLGRL